MAICVFRGSTMESGRVVLLKKGIEFEEYQAKNAAKYPICIKVYPPSSEELEEMAHSEACEAVDGCDGIEPDGYCRHGYPSWLLALGFV